MAVWLELTVMEGALEGSDMVYKPSRMAIINMAHVWEIQPMTPKGSMLIRSVGGGTYGIAVQETAEELAAMLKAGGDRVVEAIAPL